MSRILKRPMFRKGGEVMEGIMTGIKPRQNYQSGALAKAQDYNKILTAATQGASRSRCSYTIFTSNRSKFNWRTISWWN